MNNPDALIDSYVADVVRNLPRSQRNDVAFELRALLAEELQGRSDESGSEIDSALALKLLADFGRPSDVADRYRPAGFTIIKPADAPKFARIALIGVAVQWVITLFATFTAPTEGIEWLSILGGWWMTWGLGSFWWPGLLVSLSIVAAVVGEWRGSRVTATPSIRELDSERKNRVVTLVYLALGIAGASLLIALPSLASWGSALPAPLVDALALDEDFLTWRAPWAIVLWLSSLAIGIVLLVTGRWTRLLRQVSLVGSIAWTALILWWVSAGPIFESSAADETTKLILIVLVGAIVIDVVITARRLVSRSYVPAV